MKDRLKSIVILMADDSEDDRYMTREALKETLISTDVREVEDGEELMEYLTRKGDYTEETAPPPGLILLDLNMPRKGGAEALREIKADPAFRRIPVVVLTTSEDEEDIVRAYDLGVNSFITKPSNYETLVDIMRTFGRYWGEVVSIPEPEDM